MKAPSVDRVQSNVLSNIIIVSVFWFFFPSSFLNTFIFRVVTLAVINETKIMFACQDVLHGDEMFFDDLVTQLDQLFSILLCLSVSRLWNQVIIFPMQDMSLKTISHENGPETTSSFLRQEERRNIKIAMPWWRRVVTQNSTAEVLDSKVSFLSPPSLFYIPMRRLNTEHHKRDLRFSWSELCSQFLIKWRD